MSSLTSSPFSEGIVAGWGRDEHNRQITPKAKWVEVPVVSDADCLQSDLVYRYITSNRTFCAGTLNGEGM
jgi:Trypsin